MAPLADIPPMPPIPDNELSPPKRRPKSAKTTADPVPSMDESNRSVFTVRHNRRLLWWIVLIGWPLFPVMYALSLGPLATFGLEYHSAAFLLQFPPLFAAAMASIFLTQKNCVSYDLRQGWISTDVRQVQSALNRWRDGDRLEYSIALGRLEIIHANGRRRHLFRNGFTLDQRSWNAFVDVFLAHQNARAAARRGVASPPEVDVMAPAPMSSIRVGVRRRLFSVVLLIGLAAMAVDLTVLNGPIDDFGPVGFFGIVAAGYIVFGAVPLICNPVLTYEPVSARLTVKRRGLPAREFPRPGYDRLEYSVYNGALYQVRLDGKRRRIASGRMRDLPAWKAFVDRYLHDHPVNRSTGGAEKSDDAMGDAR